MAYKKIVIEGLPRPIEVPDDLSDDDALELVNGMLSRGELDDLLQEVAPMSETAQDILQTPGLPQEQIGEEDPFALAQAISEQSGVPISEAIEYVATFPRQARETLKGSEFAPLATIGDIFSAPGRAISAGLGEEDLLTGMGRVDPKLTTSEGEQRGFFPLLAEGIARDPATLATLPFGGAIASGVSKVVPAALKTGTRAANIGLRGAQGVGMTGADIAFEQATRPEELGSITPEGLGMALLGGGALGGLGGAVSRPKTGTVSPITAKTGGEAKQELQKQFRDVTGLKERDIKNLPKEAQGIIKTMTPEEGGRFQELLIKAEEASRDPLLETPFEEVGKKWVQGEELLKNARSSAGQVMGEIEDRALQGVGVPSSEIWTKWGEKLEKHGLGVRQNPETKINEVYTLEGRFSPDHNTMKSFEEITSLLGQMGEQVTPRQLRDLEQGVAGAVKYGAATRSGIINSKADAATKSLKGDIKDLVLDAIEKNTDKGAVGNYKKARSQYGKYTQDLDEIQRSIGRIIETEGGDAGSRGANMTKAMLNRATNKNTRALAEEIEKLDPSLNLRRESVMADIAMKAAKTPRGGKPFLPKSMGEAARGVTDIALEKIGYAPKEFETGMLSDVLEKTTQAQQPGGTLFPDLLQYGARPLQRESMESIFPFALDEER